MRNAPMTHAFSAVALAPGEIDRAYPLVAALESGRLTPARWRAAAEAWIRSGGGETPARRGIMTLRNGRGTFHALFFFEVCDEEEDGGGGGPVLAVSRLRFIELAGAHQTLREILAAIDRLAAARGCREVRVAMGDDADAPPSGGRGIQWAVLQQFAGRDYRPRSALLSRTRSGGGDERVIPFPPPPR